MAGFLLKTKIDTSLESAFRDLHIHPTIGAGPSWFLQSQASCHGHQRPRKSSRCNNMYTSLECISLDLLVKFGQVNFAYSPPSQTRFSSIQNNRNTYLWIWRLCKNLARSTLCTLPRHRPGSLPFKTTGIHIYEFGIHIYEFVYCKTKILDGSNSSEGIVKL